MTIPEPEERAGPLPLYRRISDELRARIEAGDYRPGDRLPSELELARAHNVSRITSRQALDVLGAEGLLVRRQGMGSFVAPRPVTQPLVRLTDFVEDMAQAGLRPESTVLRFEEDRSPASVADHLGLGSDSPVYRLDRLRLADSVPIALDWTWLPLQFGKLLLGEDLATRTIYSILETDYEIPIVSGRYTIEAAVAEPSQAHLLDISPGAPLLVFDRTSFTSAGKPVYHQTRFYRADRVRYQLTLERTSGERTAIQSFAPVFVASPPADGTKTGIKRVTAEEGKKADRQRGS